LGICRAPTILDSAVICFDVSLTVSLILPGIVHKSGPGRGRGTKHDKKSGA
jgi:hypothetical protein